MLLSVPRVSRDVAPQTFWAAMVVPSMQILWLRTGATFRIAPSDLLGMGHPCYWTHPWKVLPPVKALRTNLVPQSAKFAVIFTLAPSEYFLICKREAQVVSGKPACSWNKVSVGVWIGSSCRRQCFPRAAIGTSPYAVLHVLAFKFQVEPRAGVAEINWQCRENLVLAMPIVAALWCNQQELHMST